MLLEFDGTFIFALVSFIIFVILMNLILYRPILKIMNERQKFFDKNDDTVLKSKQKAADILKQKDEEILGAKLEASDILSKNKEELKNRKESILLDKKDEIKEKTAKFTENLHNEKNHAKAQLKHEVSEFVKLSVSKILNSEINDINVSEEDVNRVMEGQKNAWSHPLY